jgi:hypothetical protein
MFIFGVNLCYAEEKIDNYRWIVSARIIGEYKGEDVIKARVKEEFKTDDYYTIYTYRILRNSKQGQLDTIETYNKDGAFIESTLYEADVTEMKKSIIYKIVEYIDKRGE